MATKKMIQEIFCAMKVIRKYVAVLQLSFTHFFVHRTALVMLVISYTVWLGVTYFVWKAVLINKISSYQFGTEQLASYLVLSFTVRSLIHSFLGRDIADDIRTGNIVINFIRPVNYQLYQFAIETGRLLYRFILISLPVFILGTILLELPLPRSILNLLLFLVSCIFGFLIFNSLGFIIGLISFITEAYRGISAVNEILSQLFSGFLIPLYLLPGWLSQIMQFLPHPTMIFTPVRVYQSDDIFYCLNLLGVQIFWIVVLYTIGMMFQHYVVKRLTIAGG